MRTASVLAFAALVLAACSGTALGPSAADADAAAAATPAAGGAAEPGAGNGSEFDAAALPDGATGILPDGAPIEDSGAKVDASQPKKDAGGPARECVTLDACCDELGSSMYSTCKQVVNSNYASSCSQVLSTYKNQSYCSGGTTCKGSLATCCKQLPAGQGWKTTCDYYVDLNNENECVRMLGTYQQDGYCGGGPQGACTSLASCCNHLPSGSRPTCDYYVQRGSQTDCATVLNNYRTAGSCP